MGGRIEGTEGDDVVVTRGAKEVVTFGGDDVVCETSDDEGRAALRPEIDTGGGDDVVVVGHLRPNALPTTYLGAGADTYLGGQQADEVWTADLDERTADGWWTVADGRRPDRPRHRWGTAPASG